MSEPARRAGGSLTWWDALEPVRRDPSIGPAVKLAYWLALAMGGR